MTKPARHAGTPSEERAHAPAPDGAAQPGEAPVRRPPRQPAVREIDGPPGPEPTRYGDWEKGGRCSDF